VGNPGSSVMVFPLVVGVPVPTWLTPWNVPEADVM
jgi:hypothetical protein